MHPLRTENGCYYIDCPVPFRHNGYLSEEDISESLQFAYDMTFGAEGQHRSHRSGGTVRRHAGEIFADTFQGKLAEYAFYNLFRNMCEVNLDQPDTRRMGLAEWDSCDFTVNGKEIAVKSTKHFGNLLLLETKDWDDQGRYIPNFGKGCSEYDYFVFIRIYPECASIMKKNRWYYSDKVEFEDLWPAVFYENWAANLVGYITREDLVQSVIKAGHILPKGSNLNGTTVMDAENYYIQAGDMHSMSELIVEFKHGL